LGNRDRIVIFQVRLFPEKLKLTTVGCSLAGLIYLLANMMQKKFVVETHPKKCSQSCQRDKWGKYIQDPIANGILTNVPAN
jgi:hypothetical protein